MTYVKPGQVVELKNVKLDGGGFTIIFHRDFIGTAKLIGIVVLAIPKFPRLKEWAYAGFSIDFIAGFWSHAAVQGLRGAIPLLIPTVLLVVSYTTFRKLQVAATSGAAAAATVAC